MDEDKQTTLDKLRDIYLYETDDELGRKRKVYLQFIVQNTEDEIRKGMTDLAFSRDAYEVLSAIVRKRERDRQRREFAKEMAIWVGVAVASIGGVIASPFVRAVWDAISALTSSHGS